MKAFQRVRRTGGQDNALSKDEAKNGSELTIVIDIA